MRVVVVEPVLHLAPGVEVAAALRVTQDLRAGRAPAAVRAEVLADGGEVMVDGEVEEAGQEARQLVTPDGAVALGWLAWRVQVMPQMPATVERAAGCPRLAVAGLVRSAILGGEPRAPGELAR